MRGSVNREASLDVMVRMLGGSALGLLARPTQAELCEFACQLPEGRGSVKHVISDRRVLKAARCVDRVSSSSVGVAVVHGATRLGAAWAAARRLIAVIYGHPGWDAGTLDLGIGFPQLSEPAEGASRATGSSLAESGAKAERDMFAEACVPVSGSASLVYRGEIRNQLRPRPLPALSGGAIQ